MLVLGIADGQTSGACVVADGQILSAINEERMVRKKQARGFPRGSIAEAMRLAGVEAKDIEAVTLSDLRAKHRDQVDDWPGWFEARAEGRGGINDMFFNLASQFGGLAYYAPRLARLAYQVPRWPYYRHRRRRIPEIMRDEFGIHAPIGYKHHHFSHAAAAYYTSGFRDALVVTLDGGGDGDCSHVYEVRDGVFKRLCAVDSYHSVGNYYAYVTALCGYKAKRHEGKITGLAAYGRPIFRPLFDSMIACHNGRLQNRGKVLFNRALDKIRASLPGDWSHEDIAATIQKVSEDVTRDFVAYWQRRTGMSSLAVAGGVFANVRINEEVLRVPGIKSMFVHPGMGDEGLFVGSALAVDQEDARRKGKPYEPRNLPDVYLGSDICDRDGEAALRDAEVEFDKPANMAAEVAELLSQGKVVARARGRMEYGPRALGNRTIMYQPNDPSVNDWLNELLRRTEFMPFAPACTWESAEKLYVDPSGAMDTARFMTVTLHCTPWMQKHCAGVVHVDATARPQLVRREENPEYYDIIREYEKQTGVPVIINTSFNIHEEPIIRTAADAVRAFLDSRLDYLQLGPFLAKGPVGSEQTRDKWKGKKSRWGRVAVPVS